MRYVSRQVLESKASQLSSHQKHTTKSKREDQISAAPAINLWGQYADSGTHYLSKHLKNNHPSNYSIIRVTLNAKLYTLWFVKVGGPMEGLTKKYDTSPES